MGGDAFSVWVQKTLARLCDLVSYSTYKSIHNISQQNITMIRRLFDAVIFKKFIISKCCIIGNANHVCVLMCTDLTVLAFCCVRNVRSYMHDTLLTIVRVVLALQVYKCGHFHKTILNKCTATVVCPNNSSSLGTQAASHVSVAHHPHMRNTVTVDLDTTPQLPWM